MIRLHCWTWYHCQWIGCLDLWRDSGDTLVTSNSPDIKSEMFLQHFKSNKYPHYNNSRDCSQNQTLFQFHIFHAHWSWPYNFSTLVWLWPINYEPLTNNLWAIIYCHEPILRRLNPKVHRSSYSLLFHPCQTIVDYFISSNWEKWPVETLISNPS